MHGQRLENAVVSQGRCSSWVEKAGGQKKSGVGGGLILRWQAPCGRGSGVSPFSAHPVSAVIRERREPSVARRGTRASSAIIHPSSFYLPPHTRDRDKMMFPPVPAGVARHEIIGRLFQDKSAGLVCAS